ncbi:MAG: ribosome recycling factor [Bacteroidales bacterium]|nr:ribosome recycling factor [Bacteroidales bacterium]
MIEKANQILAKAKDNMTSSTAFLEENLKTYRAGKANPMIFNNVMVDYYGSPTPIPQVASVTTPDAKTIMIQPWEKKMIPVIEKAIIDANVGMTPQNNGESIRCNVPALTEERRKELIKKAKAEGENSKTVIGNARRDAMDALKKLIKEGLAEDMEKDFEDKVQKATDAQVKAVDEMVAAKEKEILTV